MGFALLGEFLLALPQKEPKGLAPSSGPALLSGCLRSVIAPRGLGEGPSLAHRRMRRSLRLTPLRNDSTQPDERGVWAQPERPCRQLDSSILLDGCKRANAPCRRVSGIVAEGVERHGCRERRDGPWMALRDVPLEQRWRERTPAQPGPYDGASVFAFFCRDWQKKVARVGETRAVSYTQQVA